MHIQPGRITLSTRQRPFEYRDEYVRLQREALTSGTGLWDPDMDHTRMRAPMKIRSATPDDVEDLYDIRCSVVENYQSRAKLADLGITPYTISEMMVGGDYITTVAEVQGCPVGFTMSQISEGYIFAAFGDGEP